MSSRSSGTKARNEKQQKRKPEWNRGYIQNTPITNAEVSCKHCSFKARYQFVRCPECGKTQE
ncbi:MAG: hypothetical protein HY831_00270 [Candidatus Aenigmarchaeota archaeon]|nr:hypothetical protein [Candidatus Aenigmarchaeota archaeon]